MERLGLNVEHYKHHSNVDARDQTLNYSNQKSNTHMTRALLCKPLAGWPDRVRKGSGYIAYIRRRELRIEGMDELGSQELDLLDM